MKLKKFALSLVVLAACAGAFGTYESYQQSGESDALLAENVEALSDSEVNNGCKLNVLYICVTPSGNHYLYRNC